jgi:hypothetical protein
MIFLLAVIFAGAATSLSYLAGSKKKQSSSPSKRNSPPAKSKSGSPSKKAGSPFKTTFAPLSLRGSTDVNIMFERINGAHLTIFYLQKGQTDGFSKPLNDAIVSGDLTEYGFLYADSYLRLDHATDAPRKNSKGYNYRCFPQFTGDSEAPVTLAENLVAAGHLARVLSAPANNQFNTQYRVSASNDLTQNPPRSADFILTSDTIVQIIIHKYNLGDQATFYAAYPEFARYFFTPNPTYPFAAISQLGFPPGEQPDEEDVSHSDSDGD